MSMYATRVMVEPMGDVHRTLACCSRLPSLFCWLIGQKGACFSATRSPHMWRNLHRSLKLLTLLELNKAHTSEAKVRRRFGPDEPDCDDSPHYLTGQFAGRCCVLSHTWQHSTDFARPVKNLVYRSTSTWTTLYSQSLRRPLENGYHKPSTKARHIAEQPS